MNIEEAKCSIGREIKFNNIEKLSKHWQETIQKSHKISILEQIGATIFRLIFKDKNNEIIDFWDIDFYEIDIELVDIVKGMTFEEAKLNTGKEVKFNNLEQLSEYWQRMIHKGYKVFIDDDDSEDAPYIKLIFKDKENHTIEFLIVDLTKIDISLKVIMKGMTIEEAKRYIGAEVELLEHTKPYMNNHSESVANIESKNKPSKLIISDVIDGIVKVTSPEEHLYNLNPEHIALKVIKHLDMETVVLGDGISMIEKLKKLSKKALSLPDDLSIDVLISIAKQNENIDIFFIELKDHLESKTIEEYLLKNGFRWCSAVNKQNRSNYKYIYFSDMTIFICDKHKDIPCVKSKIGISFEEFEKIYLSDKPLEEHEILSGSIDHTTDKIKKLALDAGFKLKKQKDGTMDLNTYVYDFARKLINEPLEEQRKPVHEWNVDDAFYANNHGEEVEVFYSNEWVSLDEMIVALARSCNKFRIKPKSVFLKAGIYFEEDLVKIFSDNFKK